MGVNILQRDIIQSSGFLCSCTTHLSDSPLIFWLKNMARLRHFNHRPTTVENIVSCKVKFAMLVSFTGYNNVYFIVYGARWLTGIPSCVYSCLTPTVTAPLVMNEWRHVIKMSHCNCSSVKVHSCWLMLQHGMQSRYRASIIKSLLKRDFQSWVSSVNVIQPFRYSSTRKIHGTAAVRKRRRRCSFYLPKLLSRDSHHSFIDAFRQTLLLAWGWTGGWTPLANLKT